MKFTTVGGPRWKNVFGHHLKIPLLTSLEKYFRYLDTRALHHEKVLKEMKHKKSPDKLYFHKQQKKQIIISFKQAL